MVTAEQIPYVLAGVFFMTTQPILTKLSMVGGVTEYSKFSSVLLTELGKAIFSILMLVAGGILSEVNPSVTELLQFAVPGFIYCINNWLVFKILELVDPTTFQLLGQLKIVFTGLLFRAVLRRRLNNYQWLAIWQLACGATVSQIPTTERGDQNANFLGVVLSMVSCCLSALAGIYNEKIMKDKASVSIHWQNLQLYSWGVIFCFVGDRFTQPAAAETELEPEPRGFFSGYNAWAVVLIFNNMFMGLSISAILKFVDNIARVYTHTVAMLTTMVLAVFLWHDKPPSLQMFLGIAIVSASAVQYNLNLSDVKARFEEGQELDSLTATSRGSSDEDSDDDSDTEAPRIDVPLKRA